MSFFTRIAFLVILVVCITPRGSSAADVPITVVDDLGGLLIFSDRERSTCDPDFWDVLTNRAWEEGQREITQNQNLIARPDSVLSLTCFDSFLNNLGDYADDNYPSHPNKADGFVSRLLVDTDQALILGFAGSQGLNLYQTLELLVLDQLMQATDNLTRGLDYLSNFAVCVSEEKQGYIDDNFPDRMIGDRAIWEASNPSWSAISSNLSGGVSRSAYNGCARMNAVWTRSKCYDFATESTLYKTAPAPGGEHDGFYSLQQYRDHAAAGNNSDYRTRASQCRRPQADGQANLPSNGEILCDIAAHGFPGLFNFTNLLALFGSNDVPTWNSAHSGANPDANGSDSVVDVYQTYLSMRDTTSCAPPIKTGYIVTVSSGVQYVDAVCPSPGCFFNPPSTIAGNGTCQ